MARSQLFSVLTASTGSVLKEHKSRLKLFCQRSIGLMIFMMSLCSVSFAQITSTAAGGNWNSGGTWTGGSVPSSGQTVTIATTGAGVVTVDGARTCAGLSITGQGRLTISTGNSLTVNGTVSMPRPNSGSSSELNVNTGTLTVTGLFTMGGAAVQSSSRYTTLNITTGTANLAGLTTSGVASRLIFAGGGTLNISGTLTGTAHTLTPSTGTVRFTGTAAQSIWAKTYNNLQMLNSGTKTLGGSATVAGVLTINSGSNLATGANTLTLSGTGTPLVDNGTFTASASSIVIYSGATANIAPETYANLRTSTSGTKTLAGNTTVSGVLTVNSPSTLATGANILTLSGTGTPLVDNGTFTATAGGTVIYSGATANIAPETYANLQTSTSGTKTLAGSTTVSGVLTVNSPSTLVTGANTLTLSGTGTPLVDNGTFTASASSIVIYSGATANIAPETYANLRTSTSGTKTLAGNTTVSGILTVNSPSTLETGANTLTLSGTGTPLVDNGTFTATTGGTVIYSNATANIAPETYANLQTSTSGTKTMVGNTTVSGVLTVNSSSTLATGANTLTLSGTGTPLVDNGTFTASANSTVVYSGATANIAGETYVNLQTSSAGIKTLANNATVSGVLTVNSGTLDLSNRTLTLSGSGTPFVNMGTVTPSTSTVIYSSGTSTTLAPVDYYNLTGSAGTKIFPAGTIGIAGTFTPSGGTYSVDNANIVNFKGAGPTQPIPGGFPFKKVIISGSGQKIISTTVGVTEVEIQDGPTMDITTGQLDIN
jgi:hypothetical protein